jgi:hypothetical protein
MSARRLITLAGLFIACCACLSVHRSDARDEKEPKEPAAESESPAKPSLKKTAMKAFMRKKLASSQEILEGLAMEDFELIEKGARQLKAMSVAAEFMVLKDPLYAEYADDFRRTVNKMEKAAKEKRIDGATLGYLDTTMNCVECHKYVRTVLIAK